MGAYNTLVATVECPACGREVEVVVQFKYGDRWQHEYRVGDKLRWGGNDFGVGGAAHVVVQGLGDIPCADCLRSEFDFCIHVKHDYIVSVDVAYNFVREGKTYMVLRS